MTFYNFLMYVYVNQRPINACYLHIDVLQFSTTEAVEDPNIRMEGIIYPLVKIGLSDSPPLLAALNYTCNHEWLRMANLSRLKCLILHG